MFIKIFAGCAIAALLVLNAAPRIQSAALAHSYSALSGGSPDYLLKTATGAAAGSPSQSFYGPGLGWQTLHSPHGGATLQTPAVSEYLGQFQVVVLGTDNQIYQVFYDPGCNCWSSWQRVPVPTAYSSGFTSAPAIAIYNSQFHVFARGSDHHIYHAWYDPSANRWYGWQDVSGQPSGSAPAATAYTGNNDRNELHLFYLSDDASQNLLHLIFNKSGGPANIWTTPLVEQAGPWASAPAAAQYTNQLQLWAVKASDGKLYQDYYQPGAGWSPNHLASNDLVGSAPAISPYGTQFHVFYVMGDVPGTTVTHQLFYDPSSGWNGPVVWSTLPSAPALTQFSTASQLQLWWRDP